MKTMYLTITLTAIMLACSSPKQGEETNDQAEASEITQKQDLSGVIDAYIEMKDAFVATDATNANNTSQVLLDELKKANISDDLLTATKKIAESKDIKVQRAAFKEVTDLLIPAVKAADNSTTLYIQYCPMAFDNQGANWISISEEIRNPYFGDMMLKCGKVTEEL